MAQQPTVEPGLAKLRATMPAGLRERSWFWGLGITALALLFYGLTLFWVLRSSTIQEILFIGVLNGFAAGLLFVVGHDATHGIMVPGRAANAVIGRLVFLPSFHPYAAWVHSHNIMHHGYTNLRGGDPTFVPFSPSEWVKLPVWRRALERFYRSPLGVGWFYTATVWWPWEIWPTGERLRQTTKAGPYQADRGLVVLGAVLMIWLQLRFGAPVGAWNGGISLPLSRLLLGIAWPFATVMWFIGVVTYQQHTHPRSFWFGSREDWTIFRSQICGTVEQTWNVRVNRLLMNVGHHHAHHVDPRIPLYRLAHAQAGLRRAHGEHMPHLHARWSEYVTLWRSCQLYDYASHQWLSFDGKARTEPRTLSGLIRAAREEA